MSLTQRELVLPKEKNDIDFFAFIVEQEKAYSFRNAPTGAPSKEAQFDSSLAAAAVHCPVLNSIHSHRPNETLDEAERASFAAIFVRQALSR